jgi:hypothetical protein
LDDHPRLHEYESAPPNVVIAGLDPRLSGLLLAITDGCMMYEGAPPNVVIAGRDPAIHPPGSARLTRECAGQARA